MEKIFDILTATRFSRADPVICHCFQVKASSILIEIAQGATEVDELSKKTSAGQGCGSCQCHIKRLLAGLPAECGPCAQCPGCGYVQVRCQCQAA